MPWPQAAECSMITNKLTESGISMLHRAGREPTLQQSTLDARGREWFVLRLFEISRVSDDNLGRKERHMRMVGDT
jgi:hypothetical protein